jgi:WD40 repeat protein
VAIAAASINVAPFESASELRDAHARLLEALDDQLKQNANTDDEAAALARIGPEIQQFVRRGAATGAYIEEITERTACQSLLDYWVSNLSHTGTHLGGVRLGRFDGEQLPDLKDTPCPYVGLEAFREPTFFFGREADIQAVVAQLRDAPLVLVAGASGSGKSSLVIAGVLPAMASEGPAQALCIIPPFVPGNMILENLADAVLKGQKSNSTDFSAAAEALRKDPQHLCTMVTGLQARPMLITIDQFEEVFTLCTPADREAMAANLGQLLEAGRGHRVILTMREEFRTRIVELGPLSPYLDRAWYSMRPMGYDALRLAVAMPAQRQNLQFQSGVIDDLVKKVLGQPAALPLLQFTLRSLWNARDRNRITWEVYRKIGDPLNALKTSADRFYDGLAPQTQDEVKRVLLELVRVDELLEAYRQPVAKSRLLQAGKANTEDVLRLLDDNDYVRITSGLDGVDAVVEVKHESLVRNWPRFVQWIDEKRVWVRQRLALTQAAQRWAHSGRPEEGLLTGWQLQAAEGRSDLLDLEKEYVRASFEAIDRERAALRRRTRVLWSLATCFLLAAIVAIALSVVVERQKLVVQRQNALIELQAARERGLHQAAMKMSEVMYSNYQLDLVSLLSIEATRRPDEPELSTSVLSVLTKNLELNSILPDLSGLGGNVRSVKYSPDKKILASASYDEDGNEGIVLLRDPSTGRLLHPPLRGHGGSIYELAFSPDGKILASASDDRTIRLWDVETGELSGTLHHDEKVFSVAINGKLLASGSADGKVRLWNLASRKLETTLAHGQTQNGEVIGKVYRVAFSPDGKLLASAGSDGRIVMWDVLTRKQVGEPLMVYRVIYSMAFSHDGKTVASGNSEGRVDLWDVATRKWSQAFADHLQGVWGVAFSPDDKYLAAVSDDRNISIYDLSATAPEAEPRHLGGYAGLFFSVDFQDQYSLATGADKGVVVLWSLNSGARIGRWIQPQPGDPTRVVAFTADGSTVVSHLKDKLQFWPVEMESQMSASPPSRQTDIEWSVPAPNGKDLVTVGKDNSIELWDLNARRPVATLVAPSKDAGVIAAAFSADSRTLAVSMFNSSAKQGEIWLLSIPGGKKRKPLEPFQGYWAQTLAFSPKGNILAFDDGESTYVWNLDLQKQTRIFNHIASTSLAFDPDGKLLASGARDGSVRLLDMQNSQPVPLGIHKGPVTSIAFSPDGRLLASGSLDKTILLWDVATRRQLSAPLDIHGDTVNSVVFSNPDGRWLASSADNGTIFLWDMRMSTWFSRACDIAGRNLTQDEWKQFFTEEPYRISCPAAAVTAADFLAQTGDHAGAERDFDEALRAALEAKDEEVANDVCWFGSVDGFATLVKSACEQAVELAPKDRKGFYRDSRGLDRALCGDRAGAIEDFAAMMEYIKEHPTLLDNSEALLRHREEWIAALKKGGNPFDKGLLDALRSSE